MPGLQLRPRVSGLAPAVAWLRNHDVSTKHIAGLLGIKELHVRQLAFRANHPDQQLRISVFLEDPFKPPSDALGTVSDTLRGRLHIRSEIESWTAKLGPIATTQLEHLEDRVEQMSATFWTGVRYGAGIDRFGALLAQIGRPAHFRRIRLLARLRQLIAETYAHAGYSSSAREHGLTAMLLSRAAYHDSAESLDLKQFAKTALIVSQAHLLGHEPEQAGFVLNLYKCAHERTRAPLGGEYFRQRGAVAFQSGPEFDAEARKYFTRATRVLANTVEYGRAKQKCEVLNVGKRQMNLLGPIDWDGSRELLDFMLKELPPGEIPISMNVNWTAACGFSTDSPEANRSASLLLERHLDASVGFGHQATVAWLLSLTPALPKKIRSAWVRRALYENTFRNR
jgi:hypothetical protein